MGRLTEMNSKEFLEHHAVMVAEKRQQQQQLILQEVGIENALQA